jgi:hypothetical protein
VADLFHEIIGEIRLPYNDIMVAGFVNVWMRKTMDITEDEKRVIQILVDCKPTNNIYGESRAAVDKGMPWESHKSTEMMDNLEGRCLIVKCSEGFKPHKVGEPLAIEKFWWERGGAAVAQNISPHTPAIPSARHS